MIAQTLRQTSEANAESAFRKAFIAAKKAFKPVKKTMDNSYFHSKYATLADIHEATDEALLLNGLTIHQFFVPATVVTLATKLVHVDGFYELSQIQVECEDARNPQKVKSAVTYYRRMMLEAILGITAEEDDDGNQGSGLTTKSETRSAPTAIKPASASQTPGLISEKQAARFWAIAKSKGWPNDLAQGLVREYGFEDASKITYHKYEEIIQQLEKGPEKSKFFTPKPSGAVQSWDKSKSAKDGEQMPDWVKEDIPL